MFTLVGFYESIDGAAALHNIAAIPDDHVTTQGDDVRVPKEFPNIIGEAALSAATTLTSARIVSPSLRAIMNQHISPLVNAVVFGAIQESLMHPQNPIPVQPDESLNLQLNSDAAAAVVEWGLIWLGDGVQTPITSQMYTMRATAAITLAAGVWTRGNLTFDQSLPSGRYAVVGMRAVGTNLVAARLNFVGGINRPGCPAVNVNGDHGARIYRYGSMGVWGEFDHTNQPTLEAIGVTDTTQEVFLDLVKIA